MNIKTVLITGGAGFVGSSLAARLASDGKHVIVLDNLMRRGSALNVARLAVAGVKFIHGDVRCASDWEALPPVDLIIECAAEPSVQAGTSSSPLQLIEINLNGALFALEKARHDGSALLFLSTSRVYSIEALRTIHYTQAPTRFELAAGQTLPGITPRGITEAFPTDTYRSFYGTTKRSAELFIQEYAQYYGVKALINRCGVMAGRHQMARVDQGVTALWVARHFFGYPLSYIGFGGAGLQVRDALHPADLYELVKRQLSDVDTWRGDIFNVGGGRDISFSLRELTEICRAITGKKVPITSIPETTSVDIPLYLSDTSLVEQRYAWRPHTGIQEIVRDIYDWILVEKNALLSVFAP